MCYTLALYGLILFWNGASELLQPFNPLLKFVLVKTVVFLTFWQVRCTTAGRLAHSCLRVHCPSAKSSLSTVLQGPPLGLST